MCPSVILSGGISARRSLDPVPNLMEYPFHSHGSVGFTSLTEFSRCDFF